jgi:hypothetical protein
MAQTPLLQQVGCKLCTQGLWHMLAEGGVVETCRS